MDLKGSKFGKKSGDHQESYDANLEEIKSFRAIKNF